MKTLLSILFFLCLSTNLYADGITNPTLEVTEEDAAPSTYPYKIKFPNTSVTDNGDGTISISFGTLGDITSIGDVTSGAAFDGTQGTTLTFYSLSGNQTIRYDVGGDIDFNFSDDININQLEPHLRLAPTVGDAFEIYAFGNEFYLTNWTDGTVLLKVNGDNLINFYNLTGYSFPNTTPSDNQILKYDLALGRLAWETDSAGDDSHAHTTTTLSGIDISADTNLSGDTENVLTGDALSIGTTITRDTEWDTSLEILNAVGDETGTGALVFAGSPALTGTPTLNTKGFTYDNVTDNDFEFSDDITVEDTTPHLRLTDTTASEDDFEIYTDNSQFVLTNVTDLIDILYVNSSNNIQLLRDTTVSGTLTANNLSGTNTGDNTVATSGDSATSFFSSGTLEVAIGGTGTTTSTGTGAVVLGTSPTFTTSMIIPQGANPTVDAAGKIAHDTTDDQFLYGATPRVIPYTYEKCFTVFSSAATDDNVPIWSPVDAITVTGLYCRTQGGTSVGITISDGTNAMEEVVCDADAQADDGTLVNNTFTANERIEFDTGTVTGTVDFCNVCLRYTYDRS